MVWIGESKELGQYKACKINSFHTTGCHDKIKRKVPYVLRIECYIRE